MSAVVTAVVVIIVVIVIILVIIAVIVVIVVIIVVLVIMMYSEQCGTDSVRSCERTGNDNDHDRTSINDKEQRQ